MSEALAAELADARAREEAIDPTISVVLQAPAGSGKTTVLTKRFLRLLECVDEPEEILAVTFTRKAAAAMRARILQQLATSALASSKAQEWDLLNHPSRLRIQTIDSFNFWIASQLPVTTEAGAVLNVDDHPEEIYLRAARAALIEGERDPAFAADFEILFSRRDNRWDQLEELLAHMLQHRQHWLPYLHSESDPAALRARLEASLHDFIGEALARACSLLTPELSSALSALPDVGTLGASINHVGAWQRLATRLLTKDGEWQKRQPKDHVTGLALVPPQLQLLLGSALEEIRELPPSAMDGEDRRALDALARVLRLAAAYLHIEFAAAGRIDHAFVAGAARAAFREGGLPTDLALNTGFKLRHILVDEFQDISISQFELLEDLVRGWEAGDGRTLFAVGDPMQSIYQFREAEVGLFLRIRDEGIGALRPRRLHLTSNFRTVAPLVAWTNAHFANLLGCADDPRRSAVSFTASVATRPPNALVSLQCAWFAPRDYAAEAGAIAKRIAHLKGTSPADATVAVLVQARAHAAVIATALAAENIKSIGVNIVPLNTRSVIRDLVALTRALHHLADRAAWLVVLRAPWCGATLATLCELSRRADPLLVWEALADEARLARCAPEERARLVRVRAVLARALQMRADLPLTEWLEWTWVQLGASDAYKAAELHYARAFLAAVAERAASGRWQGPADLELILKNLFGDAQASGSNPVQIMTIHHAKGLQFDHVFVPALDRALNRGREPLMRTLNLPRSDGRTDLLVAPVPKTGSAPTDINRYIRYLVRVRARHEQLRLLYVACTRAKESLHLSGAPKLKTSGEPHAGTLLERLWGALTATERAMHAGGSADAGAPPALQLQRLRTSWQRAPLPAPPPLPRLPIAQRSLETPEFSWVGETARHVGTVVHAALQRYSQMASLPTPQEIHAEQERYRRELARHGVSAQDLQGATERVVEALRRTCLDERGRWILSNTHREAVSELPLTGIAAGRLQSIIIDRSFVDAEGTRWVIDYKTSSHAGADIDTFVQNELERYRPQLTSHSQLARALGPEPVRAALYLPLLSVFRELVLSEGVGDRE
jgi:ATP-dependent exoDNAse (exonuclease V) beta subunit